MWRCAGEMLAVLACCHCAVAGVRRCAGDVMAITAVWRCAGVEVGLAVLLLLASMLLPSFVESYGELVKPKHEHVHDR